MIKTGRRGAPKGSTNRADGAALTETLKIALHSDPLRKRRIMERLVDMAADGNMQALTLLFDRLEGKAVQQIEQKLETTNMVVRAPDLARNAGEWSQMYAPDSEPTEDRKPN